MLDLQGFAGKTVVIGALWSSYETSGRELTLSEFALGHGYVLGVLEPEGDLPGPVKAVIEDDTEESSEMLWVVQVDEAGTPAQMAPLVVFDEREQLRYGWEFLTAVAEGKTGAPACLVRGVRFDRVRQTLK